MVLFERFGYKPGEDCWIVIYEIPLRPDLKRDGRPTATTSRCLTLSQLRNAYFSEHDTVRAVKSIAANVSSVGAKFESELDGVEEHIEASEMNDWLAVGLVFLNLLATIFAFVARQVYLRRQATQRAIARVEARRRLRAGGPNFIDRSLLGQKMTNADRN